MTASYAVTKCYDYNTAGNALTHAWLAVQRWRVVLCLHKAQALATMGDLHNACSVCQETVRLSSASGYDLQPHANTAQVAMLVHTSLACIIPMLFRLLGQISWACVNYVPQCHICFCCNHACLRQY